MKHTIVIFILSGALFFKCAGQETEVSNIREIGIKMAENVLQLDGYWYYRDGYGLHYAEVLTALEALKLAHQLNLKEIEEDLIERYTGFITGENKLISRNSHVDHNLMGVLPLEIYRITGDERYLEIGLSFADSQWKDSIGGGLTSQTRWWIDDMYMVGVLQMSAYRATNNAKYADRAARQLAAYVDSLQQHNGLFFHGPNSPFFWGRGNGWVASSLANVLKNLPEDNEHYAVLLNSYHTMMKSLLNYQSCNGMWRQLIDDDYAWAESSCTAMFTYSIVSGINAGLLEKNVYDEVVEIALKALIAHVNPEGYIREVGVGTNKMNDREYYYERQRVTGDMHGQAPFLWLVCELLSD